MLSRFFRLCCVVLLAFISVAKATPDLKFDVVTFCCTCSVDDHFCQPQFDHLNWPTTNGSFLAMGTDAHRLELATNGNALAVYYNTFNDGYSTNSAAQQAALIQAYATANFTSTGPRPDWVLLNEISSGLWTSDAAYRVWATAVVRELKTNYGFNVLLFSPFPNPGNNNADWQNISSNAFIGIENYLDGAQIKANGYSVSWCQGIYQSSITSYQNRGVAKAKLILTEHFAQTVAGTSWGRSGVTSNEWDFAIAARSQAARNIAFPGYATYAWAKNGMLVSDDEIIHFEDTYRTNPLPFLTPLSAPYIVLQPQSQTVPEGANIGLVVFRAGTAPTTYQWRFNGTNISGATNSTLSLANISVTNHGTYAVLLSNAVGTVFSSNAFLNVSVPPPQAFEPFAPATTTYPVGANLIGQTNAAGQWWAQAAPDVSMTNQPVLVAGNLAVGGLAGVSGNSVKFGGIGGSARFNIGTNITTGTWYFSFLCRLTDISTLNTGGVFWAGFNNSSGSQLTTPTSVGTRVVTRSATGGYNLGLDKSSGTTGSFVFAPAVFTTNDTLFVVGSYTFNTGTTSDDVSQLWINPVASSFGLANAPGGALVSTVGNDITLASFVLFNRNVSEPKGVIVDEIRVGPSWASVTPPANLVGSPLLKVLPSGSNLALSWTTNAGGFLLESNPDLNSSLWSTVGGAVYISGGDYTMTNSVGNQSRFYRLNQPQ